MDGVEDSPSVRIAGLSGYGCPGQSACACPRHQKRNKGKENVMQKYICDICGYVYDPAAGDPDSGIAPGTAFEDLPEDWVCPECGVGKDQFSPA